MNDTPVVRQHLRTLLVCSAQYAVRRHTYMPSLVSEIIQKHIDVLTDYDLSVITNTIDHRLEEGTIHEADAPTWLNLKKEILNELCNRA